MRKEELLAHADFVRALAHHLVMDEDRAAEVEQKTWLAALQHPPTDGRNLKSWFSRVMRNFVASAYRTEERRRRHEEEAWLERETTRPDEVLLRKEAIRHVTEAVLGLEEPYLSAILLRFYEDLPPRIVAQRLGIPVETAKTRIQRGLKILRGHLDERYGGDRTAWCTALAALAGIKLLPAALSAGSGMASGSGASAAPVTAGAGGLLSLKGILAVLLLGAASTLIYRRLFPPPSRPVPLVATAPANPAPPPGDEEDRSSGAVLAALPRVEDEITLPSEKGDVDRVASAGKVLAGRVKDRRTGKPVQAFDFVLKEVQNWRCTEFIHETVRNPEGRFSFPLKPGTCAQIAVWANGYTRYRSDWFDVSREDGLDRLQVKLDPGLALEGRVVDAETNRPVAGAVVGPALYPWETDLVRLELLGFSQGGIQDRTGPDGRFRLQGLRPVDTRFAAVHPDYAEGVAEGTPGRGGSLLIRLNRGARIRGTVYGQDGRPAGGVLIRLFGEGLPLCRALRSEADGTYTTPPLRPGRIFVKAGDPPPEMADHPPFAMDFHAVDLRDRDVVVDLGANREHVTWTGTILDFQGRPAGGACLRIFPALYPFQEVRSFHLRRVVFADEAGRFKVEALHPGRYRVDAFFFRSDRYEVHPCGIRTFEGPGTVEQNIDLRVGILLAGAVVDQESGMPLAGVKGVVSAQKEGEGRPYTTRIDGEGRFAFQGLPPGNYRIEARVKGYAPAALTVHRAAAGQRQDRLRLALEPAGRLRILWEGFDEGEEVFLALRNERSGKIQYLSGRVPFAREGGDAEWRPLSLRTGEWTASFCFGEGGYTERHVTILRGKETLLDLHRGEVPAYFEMRAVSGIVARADGRPVPGLALRLFPDPSHTSARMEGTPPVFEVVTDVRGAFFQQGLWPGRFGVQAVLPSGKALPLPPLWVPAKGLDPVPYRALFCQGRITGRLADGARGLPLGLEGDRSWTVDLLSLRTGKRVDRYAGKPGDEGFLLHCAEPGPYRLHVEAEGYDPYDMEDLRVEGSDAPIDVGTLSLTPCGLLDLQVMAASGDRIDECWIRCDGLRRSPCRVLPDGRLRFTGLPLGRVKLTVGGAEYFEQDLEVVLLEEETASARVVLDPR